MDKEQKKKALLEISAQAMLLNRHTKDDDYTKDIARESGKFATMGAIMLGYGATPFHDDSVARYEELLKNIEEK